MCAAPVGANADKERGCRLSEEIKKIGRTSDSPAARSRFLGVEDSKYRRYEAGANIPNELLGKIASMGGDVVYILTGVRSTPSPVPADHTSDESRKQQYHPGPNRAMNVIRLISEIEGYMQIAGGDHLKRWDASMEDILTKLEAGLPRAQLAMEQAEEQAQKSQAG